MASSIDTVIATSTARAREGHEQLSSSVTSNTSSSSYGGTDARDYFFFWKVENIDVRVRHGRASKRVSSLRQAFPLGIFELLHPLWPAATNAVYIVVLVGVFSALRQE